MSKKYELTKNKIKREGRTLYRIRALKDFSDVKKGDFGGFIEKEYNLSHEGDCWVYEKAKVYDDARVYGYAARIYDNVKVFDRAKISDNAIVFNNSEIFGDAWVYGKARIKGQSRINKLVSVNRSDGYTFTLLPQKGGRYKISAGCRFFTFKSARDHWKKTRGGTELGDETLKILDYLESFCK